VRTTPFTALMIALALAAPTSSAAAQSPDSLPALMGFLPGEHQIAAAVLALPEEFRAEARVFGFTEAGSELATLREGKGPFVCLAPNPAATTFHVACYHESLEPFMARGRALRAAGVVGDQVDTVRFREVESRQLAMPDHPAALYSLTGPVTSFDATLGTAEGARPLFVIYIAGATAASTGLSEKPAVGTPWLMFPGTPKAHIMFVPRM
jgi:hypothetical protein